MVYSSSKTTQINRPAAWTETCSGRHIKKKANLSTHLIHFRKLCHASTITSTTDTASSTGPGHKRTCGKCSLCGCWGSYRTNMVYDLPTICNTSTGRTYRIANNLNCRNFGIYAAICTHCPAIYVGQTVTSFKDRWNGHRNSWKRNMRGWILMNGTTKQLFWSTTWLITQMSWRTAQTSVRHGRSPFWRSLPRQPSMWRRRTGEIFLRTNDFKSIYKRWSGLACVEREEYFFRTIFI